MAMTPEETFRQLLRLGKAWRVVEARLEACSSTFLVKLEETPDLWPEESTRAGTPVICHNDVEPIQWLRINVINKECLIVCGLPRGQRSNEGNVCRVTRLWERRSKHFTQEFDAFTVTLKRKMPVKRSGEILCESGMQMWRILIAHVKAAHGRLSFDNVLWVGADKMNRRKGHNYLTVFADLVANRVLFATQCKDPSDWAAFAAGLLRHNRHPRAI
jgi:transposase